MDPIEINSQIKKIQNDFQFSSAEFWVLKSNSNEQSQQQSHLSPLVNKQTTSQWLLQNNILNLFRSAPIYQIPGHVTIEKLSNLMFQSQIEFKLLPSHNIINPQMKLNEIKQINQNIIDIYYDICPQENQTNTSFSYSPNMSIFNNFEKCGGVQQIIEVILKSLTLWKNKERSQNWFIWVKELSCFSTLPHFFGLFIKDANCMNLLFSILAGKPDEESITKESTKKWEETEQQAVRFQYQILSDVFRVDKEYKLRKFAIENDLVERLLDRLQIISKEEKRQFMQNNNNQNSIIYMIYHYCFKMVDIPIKTSKQLLKHLIIISNNKIHQINFDLFFHFFCLFQLFILNIINQNAALDINDAQQNQLEQQQITPKEMTEEDYKLKVVKKKGIGYASDNTGQNAKWNISEYQETVQVKNGQIQSLISILESFLDIDEWESDINIFDLFCSSSLLPLLESAFRSSSLLDMSKYSELYTGYLKLVNVICKHKVLLPLLLNIDPHYRPQQTESLRTLLKNLAELANIFLKVHSSTSKTDNQSQDLVTMELASQIRRTYDIVEETLLSNEDSDDDDQIEQILKLPLPEKYRTLLKDLRFDYMNIQDEATQKFTHHYASYILPNHTVPQQKIIRLAQELADLSTALPIEHTNAIFVRCDQNRVDVMKALIMGASGTPYAHGAFEFDIYFEDTYPQGPPKVNLQTTGAGKTRFNPNLYSCGKVCLSLLGTWRGNASENWDAKMSTLLQVLVSIQAIIMSEEVYFNEPGFEGEAGTEEGEKKNEAYANIVRYSNIMFAMIGQIKNPSKGFEAVIRRHFYIKRDEIMEECNKWIKFSEVRGASYTGLIHDHNNQWSQQFKQSKKSYETMLKDAVKQLDTEMRKLTPPKINDLKPKTKKQKQKKQLKSSTEGIQNLDTVDVSYDQNSTQKELNFESEEVKDRWSRYIGAMGIEAVKKQANASVFVSGLGPLGIEISKNVVLSGVKKFTIHDSKQVSWNDLSGQFFLGEENIGQNRAKACQDKLQQLNYYVKVDQSIEKQLPLEDSRLDELGLKDYTMVILTDSDYETQVFVDNYCRKNKVKFISADCTGPYARLFVDLGEEFDVLDKNGEETPEMMIKKISNEEKGVVTLLTGAKHNLEDNDTIIFNQVKGMKLKQQNNQEQSQLDSINGTLHKVTVINSNSFYIGDTRDYEDYQIDGLCKQVKLPVKLKFKSFEMAIKCKDEIPLDENMQIHDFMKMNGQMQGHVAYETLDIFVQKYKSYPRSWEKKDNDEFLKLSNQILAKYSIESDDEMTRFLKNFAYTCMGNFAPICAFMGGFIAQEIVKSITQKYLPVKQLFYTNCDEVIPQLPEKEQDFTQFLKDEQLLGFNAKERNEGLRIVIGGNLLSKIQDCKLFMVGAGAIGCELLKNFAMIGLGTKGKIILTDPDVIEVSNLNRQFLFREKHIRKPKSSTAAAAAIQMNPELKGHIEARLDKVHDGTSDIFNDQFFEGLTIVANALDNVQARRYVDNRCVNSKIPLLESGTLGPKGHVQVIIPYKTESYGSQADPQEEGEIPHCTLKMFPEETLHCVEWARDKFSKIFNQRPKALAKFVAESQLIVSNNQELKTLNEAILLVKKMPKSFDDCIVYARHKFQKYFINDIRQLMHTYPLDAKTKEGNPFWSLPKRPPTEVQFDPNNKLHQNFIGAMACLRAKVFKIKLPDNPRSEQTKKLLAIQASQIIVPDFQPSEEKSQQINSQIEKDKSEKVQEQKDNEKDNEQEQDDFNKAVQEASKLFQNVQKDQITPEEFEKDDDQNCHIDFIYSLANNRSANYKLDPMDWLTVKIKAGRIIPALATTTASIAGLQTIELVKLLKNCKLDTMKNAFLNLAVPLLQLSEPGPAPVKKLHSDLIVSIWDRWDITLQKEPTLNNLYEYLQNEYKMIPRDLMWKSKPIYFSAIYNMPGKEKEKKEILSKTIHDLLGIEKGEDKYVDLTVTFQLIDDSKQEIIEGTPIIRLNLKQ